MKDPIVENLTKHIQEDLDRNTKYASLPRESFNGPWNDPNVKWVCEKHPDKPMNHKIFGLFECGGAGMMDEKSRKKYGEL